MKDRPEFTWYFHARSALVQVGVEGAGSRDSTGCRNVYFPITRGLKSCLMSDVKLIPITDKYRDGWERTFGKPEVVLDVTHCESYFDNSQFSAPLDVVWDGDRT